MAESDRNLYDLLGVASKAKDTEVSMAFQWNAAWYCGLHSPIAEPVARVSCSNFGPAFKHAPVKPGRRRFAGPSATL